MYCPASSVLQQEGGIIVKPVWALVDAEEEEVTGRFHVRQSDTVSDLIVVRSCVGRFKQKLLYTAASKQGKGLQDVSAREPLTL